MMTVLILLGILGRPGIRNPEYDGKSVPLANPIRGATVAPVSRCRTNQHDTVMPESEPT
jgi:hypothetical protein